MCAPRGFVSGDKILAPEGEAQPNILRVRERTNPKQRMRVERQPVALYSPRYR